ncbi:hypothetical protein J31TS4_02740 [Paenibacillus sp. J31TS4]|uniref:sugar isomerase domain-containing protein n=1 Tax=Paenibacillus sp. J31TS4 TaxID=2807195 RepID=UPI001B1469A7|nr:SIS domain-containing protein [Paenibacillus sp. J31TS4]GIP36994.1 hypothetical protein J31TS4_02740 [Paenibacillus sp. J31TS4]
MQSYFEQVSKVLETIQKTQQAAMQQAAAVCAEAISSQRMIFILGTGHSHMLAEEPYYRAGGLVPILPILDTGLMLHEDAVKSTQLERLKGYAAILLDRAGVGRGDVLFIASNSGINSVPVEAALEARQRGAYVIALTSLAHSRHAEPRHPSGSRLYEAADLVLDNCGVHGDAAVHLEGLETPIGPTSTIAGAFIMNSIVVKICENLLASGVEPPVFRSANVAGGEAHNNELIERLRQAGYRLRL